MSTYTSGYHAEQIMELVKDFIRLRPHLRGVLPEELVRMKTRLEEAYPGGKVKGPADYALLYSIATTLVTQSEPITMGELGRALNIPLSTATRVIKWCVQAGYVERLPDPEDRRVVRVALTKTGRQLLKKRQEFMRGRIQQVLGLLEDEEQETLVRLLRKLVDGLDEEHRVLLER